MIDSIKAEVTELTAELAKLAADYPEQLKRLILSVCEMATNAAARIEADAATIARLEGENLSRIDAMTLMCRKLAEWQASQHYTYIDKRGQPVLARDLEGRAEAAEAKVAALVEALQKIAEWPDYRLPKPCDIARAAIAAAKGGAA